MLPTLPITPPAGPNLSSELTPPAESPERAGDFAQALREAGEPREAEPAPSVVPEGARAPAPTRGGAKKPQAADRERQRTPDGARAERAEATSHEPASTTTPAAALPGGERMVASDDALPATATIPDAGTTPPPLAPAGLPLPSVPPKAAGASCESPSSGTEAALRPDPTPPAKASGPRSIRASIEPADRPRSDTPDAGRAGGAASVAPAAAHGTTIVDATGAPLASRPRNEPESVPSITTATLPPPTTAPARASEAIRADAAVATLREPLGSRGFEQQFGQQVGLWVRDGVQEARLQLNPAELGPVLISITLDGQAAQIDFHAAQPRTREAIEQSLPALASALRDSGFTLAGGGVFGQTAGRGDERAAPPPPHPAAREAFAAGADTAATAPVPARPPGWRRGLLDVFA